MNASADRPTLLVVDDEPGIADLLSVKSRESIGFSVSVAHDGNAFHDAYCA